MKVYGLAPLLLLVVIASPSGCTSSISPSSLPTCGPSGGGVCLDPQQLSEVCGPAAITCPDGMVRACATSPDATDDRPLCRDRVRYIPCPTEMDASIRRPLPRRIDAGVFEEHPDR